MLKEWQAPSDRSTRQHLRHSTALVQQQRGVVTVHRTCAQTMQEIEERAALLPTRMTRLQQQMRSGDAR